MQKTDENMFLKNGILFKLLAVVFGFLAIVVGIVYISLHQTRDVMMAERKILLRSVVEMSIGIVSTYYDKAQAGVMSEEEAKSRAKAAILSMSYGKEGYIYINNTKGVNIAHPIYPTDAGLSMWERRDAHGTLFIQDQIRLAPNGGFNEYYFKKPAGGAEPLPKVGYSKLFAPWDWVITTGLYVDDIDASYEASLMRWGKLITLPVVLLVVLAFYIAHLISKPMIALEKARVGAEIATRAKSDFLANMSHEIRTPLNGAMGMLALLLGTKMTVQQREWAQIAHQSAEELLNLINDILDISKVEAGQMALENLPFDLQANIKAVTDLLYPRAHRKGVEILSAFQPDLPRMVVGDPVRLRQILLNLVGNAVKFTQAGTIMISVEGEAKDRDLFLRFEVKDTGIGIPEDKQTYIFEKFSQAEESTTRNFGGTGLGLAICKKLTAMMGGDVGVRSVMGQGSTFWFTVRFRTSHDATTVVSSALKGEGGRVLVALHHDSVSQLVTGYLRQWGYKPDILGESGVIASLQNAMALGDPYRFALVEVGSWGDDASALGSKMTMFMNASGETRFVFVASPDKLLPIDEVAVRRSIGILTKPIFPQDLQDIFTYLRATGEDLRPSFISVRGDHRATAGQTSFTETEEGSPPPKKSRGLILIAEDQAINQMLMKTLIRQFGCDAELAANGVQAVKMAAEKRYDLIFMDGHMPEMDGLEATKQIRAFEQRLKHHTPIVAVTADAMKGDRDKCLDAGMDDYLHKPIKAESVKAMIDRYVGPV